MIRLYFLQALYHLRENPIITWVSVLGTAMAICMIMVLVITFQVRLVDCEPEVNRSRTLYVPYMSVKLKGKSDNESANASMSVRTGRECFRALTTPEAVTLVSSVPLCLPDRKLLLIWYRLMKLSGAFLVSVFSVVQDLPVLIVMPDYRVPC